MVASVENHWVVAFGWTVLALVFVDELLAVAAFGVWGWHSSAPWLLVWLAPLLAMLAWYFFASPKAPYGGPGVRPTVKLLVFGLASVSLWGSGHPTLAVALLAFSVVVNALAMIPAIRELAETGGRGGRPATVSKLPRPSPLLPEEVALTTVSKPPHESWDPTTARRPPHES